MAIQLEQKSSPEGVTIVVSGEIDLYTSPQLREAVLKAISKADRAMGIDLSQVGYMDSSGVATLVEGLKATDKKIEFVLLTPSPPVLKVLQLTRLDSVFTIREQL